MFNVKLSIKRIYFSQSNQYHKTMRKLFILVFMVLSTISYGQTDLLPTGSKGSQKIDHTYYKLLYKNKLRQSECSYYHLTKAMADCNSERENNFKADTMVVGVRVTSKYYEKSGFDKGHLTPANHLCHDQIGMDLSFLMSNMSPQLPNFNRGIWKELEYMTKLWAIDKGDVYIFSGPIFGDSVKYMPYYRMTGGAKVKVDSIPIPTHFYKIVIHKVNSKYEVISFILPHQAFADNTDLRQFIVTVDEIEKLTSINFFSKMSAATQKTMEAQKLNGTWKFN